MNARWNWRIKWRKIIRVRENLNATSELDLRSSLFARNRLYPYHGSFSQLKTLFKTNEQFFDGILLDAGTRLEQRVGRHRDELDLPFEVRCN